jgi:aspartate kinase
MMGNSRGIVIIKFGGSVLEDSRGVDQAGALVERTLQNGVGVVVVVSALKGVTDLLVSLSKNVNPEMDPALVDEILSSGEKASARLVAAALAKRGIRPNVFDPDSPNWPILTDDRHLDANPLMDSTLELCRKYLVPLLDEGSVPVICGFLGKTREGRTTTLGRGGSDTTAVVLGNCLGAKEVVLIKDVEGVYSSDPDKVTGTQFLESLNGEEAGLLAAGGAKFVHAKALRYQTPGLRIRVTSIDKFESGTVIEGDLPDINAEVTTTDVSMVTVVGVELSRVESVNRLAGAIKNAGASIISMSVDERSAIFYVSGGKDVLDGVHGILVGEGVAKAVSSFDGLSMITVKGRALEVQPGVVQRVTQPLARSNINLYGVMTILSSVRVFVSAEQSAKALRLIKEAMGVP